MSVPPAPQDAPPVCLRLRDGRLRFLVTARGSACGDCASGIRLVSLWVGERGALDEASWCATCFRPVWRRVRSASIEERVQAREVLRSARRLRPQQVCECVRDAVDELQLTGRGRA